MAQRCFQRSCVFFWERMTFHYFFIKYYLFVDKSEQGLLEYSRNFFKV